ncbi:hypothetical protein Y032_0004g1902 [Ancylostoma ceylanicum]|uniref:Uncharacterized protein n=1 Tax=Ancylostoma ceylanicum TaxID=53326 RepID=A0A016VUF2_9BILA|nr:hypothetical protein Y032_0004g1902 [Ancylostoma ceylanicum]
MEHVLACPIDKISGDTCFHTQFRDFSCTLPDSAQRGGSECANTSMRFRRSSVYCERSGSAAPILCQTLKDSNEQV